MYARAFRLRLAVLREAVLDALKDASGQIIAAACVWPRVSFMVLSSEKIVRRKEEIAPNNLASPNGRNKPACRGLGLLIWRLPDYEAGRGYQG